MNKRINTNNYIPVTAKVGKGTYTTWYYNIENLSLTELISLKQELSHTNSVSYIDKAIYMQNISSSFSAKYYGDCKREQKEMKYKRKRKNTKVHKYK